MILIVALPLTNKGGRLAGYYMAQVSTVSLVALLSLIASNVTGYTKKTTVAALFLIAYCAGNIIGSSVFVLNRKDARLNDIFLQGHKLSMPKNLLDFVLLKSRFLVSTSVAKECCPADMMLKFAGQPACSIWASFGGTIRVRIGKKLRSEQRLNTSKWTTANG